MDGLGILEREVRELVRRRGLDPQQDRRGVMAIAVDAVADYDERSLRGAVPVLGDREAALRAVVDSVAGLGPLQAYLDDPEIEEIWVNSPSEVYVARGGASELTTTVLSDAQVRELVEQMLRSSGRRLDLSSPFVDAMLPGGERLHVVIPDVTHRHWAVNIRKFVARAQHVDDLVALGMLPGSAARFLDAAVLAGLSILVSGATQAGKTTVLTALAGSVPARERIITCEEVFELRLDHRDTVSMQCRQPSLDGTGEIPLRRLVVEALRMRPDRLIIGEVRQAEALDMLIALNAGVPGMCTIHASSAREALTKLCTLPLLAGENISDRFVVPTVAAAVDIVVHLGLDAHGRRRVVEVMGVTGRAENGVVEVSDLFSTRSGVLTRGEGYPPHAERFERLGIDVAALLRAGR